MFHDIASKTSFGIQSYRQSYTDRYRQSYRHSYRATGDAHAYSYRQSYRATDRTLDSHMYVDARSKMPAPTHHDMPHVLAVGTHCTHA